MNNKNELKIYLADIGEVRPRHMEEISPKRAEKVQKYKMADDKKRCIAAGLLLSRFLSDTQIYENEFGKPVAESGACFNLSHSGQYVILAVADCDVGCDIEKLRMVNELKTGKFVFCQSEMEMLQGSHDRMGTFFDLWTKKEALLKCMGKGFHRGAKSVDVSGESFDDGGKKYYMKTFKFSDYTISACSVKGDFAIDIEFVDFKKL